MKPIQSRLMCKGRLVQFILGCLLISLGGCASEPNLADLRKQVQTLTDQQRAFEKQTQALLDRMESLESQVDQHDFLAGELMKTEEERSLDTSHLLGKLEQSSSRLRKQIEQTRVSAQKKEQDLSIRIKAIESRLDNMAHAQHRGKPKSAKPLATEPQRHHQEHVDSSVNQSLTEPLIGPPNQTLEFRSAYKVYLDGHYDRAVVEFQRFLKHHPTATLAPHAYYYMGDSHYIQKDYEAATQAWQRVITEYPENKYIPPALLKLGLVMIETDQMMKAHQLWDRVIQEFPDSPEASQAQDHISQSQETS